MSLRLLSVLALALATGKTLVGAAPAVNGREHVLLNPRVYDTLMGSPASVRNESSSNQGTLKIARQPGQFINATLTILTTVTVPMDATSTTSIVTTSAEADRPYGTFFAITTSANMTSTEVDQPYGTFLAITPSTNTTLVEGDCPYGTFLAMTTNTTSTEIGQPYGTFLEVDRLTTTPVPTPAAWLANATLKQRDDDDPFTWPTSGYSTSVFTWTFGSTQEMNVTVLVQTTETPSSSTADSEDVTVTVTDTHVVTATVTMKGATAPTALATSTGTSSTVLDQPYGPPMLRDIRPLPSDLGEPAPTSVPWLADEALEQRNGDSTTLLADCITTVVTTVETTITEFVVGSTGSSEVDDMVETGFVMPSFTNGLNA
ncbi:hypothetical protein VTJ49DRAFT_3748 [Mycothermus thermophilus]|uniref:Uncharacterized protein n=1 Tax=Humicola insolens TaxID=85995 RepID=A0ABR3V8Q7_HUMIN